MGKYCCDICDSNKCYKNKQKLETHKLSIKHACKAGELLIAKVYKFSKLIDNILESYIGSTHNLEHRHEIHKYRLNKPKKYKSNFYVFLRERKLTIDNFKLEVLYEWNINCKGKNDIEVLREMSEKEQQFIDKLQPTLNMSRASGWDVEKHKETQKQWYLENKVELNKYRREKIPCDICGKVINNSSIKYHQSSRSCVKPTVINNITNNITNNIKKQVNITEKKENL